jgi:hypothetical protein
MGIKSDFGGKCALYSHSFLNHSIKIRKLENVP